MQYSVIHGTLLKLIGVLYYDFTGRKLTLSIKWLLYGLTCQICNLLLAIAAVQDLATSQISRHDLDVTFVMALSTLFDTISCMITFWRCRGIAKLYHFIYHYDDNKADGGEKPRSSLMTMDCVSKLLIVITMTGCVVYWGQEMTRLRATFTTRARALLGGPVLVAGLALLVNFRVNLLCLASLVQGQIRQLLSYPRVNDHSSQVVHEIVTSEKSLIKASFRI